MHIYDYAQRNSHINKIIVFGQALDLNTKFNKTSNLQIALYIKDVTIEQSKNIASYIMRRFNYIDCYLPENFIYDKQITEAIKNGLVIYENLL